MPRNLELKARCRSLSDALNAAAMISETPGKIINQEDSYYCSSTGRLKLRETDVTRPELVWYHRDESSDRLQSRYERSIVQNPKSLKAFLSKVFGVDVNVKKKRHLFIWNNSRIHIDEVEGVGTCIEFEVLLDDGDNGEERLQYLIGYFKIETAAILRCSYADLLRDSVQKK